MTKNGKAEENKKINIALRGGGSHGAFSWGADRLLEDGREIRPLPAPAPAP